MEENVTHTMTDKSMSKQFDLSSATANVRAYQAKLIEMTQANMTVSFEFSQRLATVRSPVELFTVIAEFTGKRIALLGKYSKEMIELGAKGTAVRCKAITSLPTSVRLWFDFCRIRLVEIVALLCARWPLRWLGNEMTAAYANWQNHSSQL